jgi:hypothetical protein
VPILFLADCKSVVRLAPHWHQKTDIPTQGAPAMSWLWIALAIIAGTGITLMIREAIEALEKVEPMSELQRVRAALGRAVERVREQR